LGRKIVADAQTALPSIDKDTHACHRSFSALFAFFSLMGDSPPASKKAENHSKIAC
jgi:hypothetical protein